MDTRGCSSKLAPRCLLGRPRQVPRHQSVDRITELNGGEGLHQDLPATPGPDLILLCRVNVPRHDEDARDSHSVAELPGQLEAIPVSERQVRDEQVQLLVGTDKVLPGRLDSVEGEHLRPRLLDALTDLDLLLLREDAKQK